MMYVIAAKKIHTFSSYSESTVIVSYMYIRQVWSSARIDFLEDEVFTIPVTGITFISQLIVQNVVCFQNSRYNCGHKCKVVGRQHILTITSRQQWRPKANG